MKRILILPPLAVVLLAVAAAVRGAQPAAPLERHEFVIHDFHTESGATLPEARVVSRRSAR